MTRLAIPLTLCALAATGALAQPSREARAWAHLCPWNALNNLSHNRRDFPLGLGMETQPGMAPRTEAPYLRDYIYECLSAAGAGLDAFALDIIVGQPLENWAFALDGYLQAAETVAAETGRPFYIAPCLDSPKSRSVTELAAYIVELMGTRAASPAWPTFDGRPVLWTYAGSAMTAEEWAAVLDSVARSDLLPVIIMDANALFARVEAPLDPTDPWSGLPVAELDRIAQLPIALYPFRTDFNLLTMGRCLTYLRQRHPGSVAARLSIGTIWPGYWSLGNGWYVDPQGTGLIRQTSELARDSRWLTVTTWNDFYETTHFQPSIGFGTGRLDLLHAQISQWRGHDPWPAEPRVYLWQPNEVQAGEPMRAQVLCLTPRDTGTVEARVSLCGPDGVVPEPTDWLPITGAEIRAADFDLGQATVPAGQCQYLLLEVRLPGQPEARALSEPICVWPEGYHPLATRRGTLWRLGEQARGPQAVDIALTDQLPQRLEVTWPPDQVPPGSRLHVRQNNNLIHFPGETPGPVVYDMEATYGEGRAPWEVYPPVPIWQRWGFFDSVIVLPDGSLRWSEPRWVPPAEGADLECAGWWPMDDGTGRQVRDLSPYGHTATFFGDPVWVTPGRVGAACLQFDGQDDALELPGGRFPPGPFTFRAWVKPAPDAKDYCLFAEINGCLVLSHDRSEGLSARRQHAVGWAVASRPPVRGREPALLAPNTWSRVTVTYDTGALRLYLNGELLDATPCAGYLPSNVTALACNPFGARGEFFAGCLDDVSIEARALSDEEVARDAMQ